MRVLGCLLLQGRRHHHHHHLSLLSILSSLLPKTLLAISIVIIMSPTSVMSTKIKTIYLIRHAESEENRRIASFFRIFSGLGKFSLPSKSDVKDSVELLNVVNQVDSNVSAIGKQQIDEMAQKLQQTNFLSSTGITLVTHSPLLRARQTCEGVLGCVAAGGSHSDSTSIDNHNTVAKKVDGVDRVIEVDLLAEKTPQEWTPMYYNTFLKRIDNFEQWLAEQPDEHIAIVGHSQYFKAMLGLDFKFSNVSVWKVSFDPSKKEFATGAATTTPNDEDSTTPTPTTEPQPPVSVAVTNDSKENTTTSWKLPPQYSHLSLLYKCNVESSEKYPEEQAAVQ